MKKHYLLFFSLVTPLLLASCGINDSDKSLQETNAQLSFENIELKKQNQELSQKIEWMKNMSNSGVISQNKEENTPSANSGSGVSKEEYKSTSEEIKLAGCEQTKKVGNVEWCLKNSELIKPVEGFDVTFSRSVQNDSGIKGVYTNDKEDKLYTFEYLKSACGFVEAEGLEVGNSVKASCPCPSGYHVPLIKEWKDTILFYKENAPLISSELSLPIRISNRNNAGGSYSNYYDIGQYHSSSLNSLGEEYSTAVSFNKNAQGDYTIVTDSPNNGGKAISLRCVKN